MGIKKHIKYYLLGKSVKEIEMDRILDKIKKNDLWIGNIEYLKNPVIEHGSLLKSVQNKYLELIMIVYKEFVKYLFFSCSFLFGLNKEDKFHKIHCLCEPKLNVHLLLF